MPATDCAPQDTAGFRYPKPVAVAFRVAQVAAKTGVEIGVGVLYQFYIDCPREGYECIGDDGSAHEHLSRQPRYGNEVHTPIQDVCN